MLRLFRLIHLSTVRLRRHLRPVGQVMLGLCLFAAAIGVNTEDNVAHALFTLTASLLLLDGLAVLLLGWRRRRGAPVLAVVRQLPPFLRCGQDGAYHLQLRNTGPRPLQGAQLVETLHQPYPRRADFRARGPQRHSVSRNPFDRRVGYPDFVDWLRRLRGLDLEAVPLPRLNPGQSASLRVTVHPVRRALAAFLAPALAQASPLGLFWVFQPVTCSGDSSVCILPAPLAVDLPQPPSHRHIQPGGLSLAMRVGDTEEFRALRDYRPGDPLRAVHWRSWARTGRPVVREYQDEFFARHALVLDTAAPSPFAPELDTAVALATGLVARPRDGDSLLDLMFVGDRVHRLTAGRGLGQTDALLRVLATVTSSPPASVADLLAALRHNAPRLDAVVAVLVAWDALRQDALAALLALRLEVTAYVVAEPDEATRAAAEQRFGGRVRWLAPQDDGVRP